MNRRNWIGSLIGGGLSLLGLGSLRQRNGSGHLLKMVPMLTTSLADYEPIVIRGELIARTESSSFGPGQLVALPMGWEVKSITSSLNQPTTIEVGPMPEEDMARITKARTELYGTNA